MLGLERGCATVAEPLRVGVCLSLLRPRNSEWQTELQPPGEGMPSAKQLAYIGFKTSASMMLFTVYGGYLCSVRAYLYLQLRSARRQAAEEQQISGVLRIETEKTSPRVIPGKN